MAEEMKVRLRRCLLSTQPSSDQYAGSMTQRRPVAHELLSQRHARPVEPRLDCGEGLAQDLRRFLVRQLLDIPQDEDDLVGLGQPFDGASENPPRLIVDELGLRAL